MKARVYLGCSGWSYPSWRPVFYPARTSLKKLLTAYAARLNTVEVNYTFRALPSASVTANWLAQTPQHFRFACKAPERITHRLRLHGAAETTHAFATALAPLHDANRLGPILFQLPPGFTVDPQRLDTFLTSIAPLGLTTTWEFRDRSWFNDSGLNEEIGSVLQRHNADLCMAESDTLQSPDRILNKKVHVFRLRRSGYDESQLTAFAQKFVSLAQSGTDVYAFFKHEEAPDGPLRAARVLEQIPEEWRG